MAQVLSNDEVLVLRRHIRDIVKECEAHPNDFSSLINICNTTLNIPENSWDTTTGILSEVETKAYITATIQHEYENEEAILDIAIVYSGESVPMGFSKVDRTPTGIRADLNKGCRGQFVYLCLKRGRPNHRLPIGDIMLLYPDRGEKPPPEYEIILRRGSPVNLNTGTLREKLYICTRRSRHSYLTDVTVIFPDKGEVVPERYMKVDISPRGYQANEPLVAGGIAVSICYRKHNMYTNAIRIRASRKLEKNYELVDTFTSNAEMLRPVESLESNLNANFDLKIELSGQTAQSNTVRADRALLPIETDPACCISLCDCASQQACIYFYPLLESCCIRHGIVSRMAVNSLYEIAKTGILKSTCRQGNNRHFHLLDIVAHLACDTVKQGIDDQFADVLNFVDEIQSILNYAISPRLLNKLFRTVLYVEKSDFRTIHSPLCSMLRSYIDHQSCKKNHTIAIYGFSKLSNEQFIRKIIEYCAENAIKESTVTVVTESVIGLTKSPYTLGSEEFWATLGSIAQYVSADVTEASLYQLIATACKVLLQTPFGSAQEALMLNYLHVALMEGKEFLGISQLFGHQIRRLLCGVVGSSISKVSTKNFRLVLKLVSDLWNDYRSLVKVELAILLDNMILPILKSSLVEVQFMQVEVLIELTEWFQLPHNMIEIFLNYDMDRQSAKQWKIFEQLGGAMCSLAEGGSSESDEAEEVQIQDHAMNCILTILRSLMDTSGHAHLISRDAKTRNLSMLRGWEQDESCQSEITIPNDALWKSHENVSIKMRNKLSKQRQHMLKTALKIMASKNLKKGIEYLVATNFLSESARDVASFLRIHQDAIGESEIGDYLGEGDGDFKVQLRLTYVRAVSFAGKSLIEALRHFLTNGGFRLPGESQKIERLVEVFAQCYWDDSPKQFSSSDTVMILAYSCIMLNTDLHNPNVKKNKMSSVDFIKNNRGIDNGKDIPSSVLIGIYNSIVERPIRMASYSDKVPQKNKGKFEDFRHTFAKSANRSEELMKDLSHTKRSFRFVGVDTNISPDLVAVLFERVWFHIFALSTSILSNSQSSLKMTLCCLDLLRYSISICLFLELKTEREAFVAQLAKLKHFREHPSALHEQEMYMDNESYHTEGWYCSIEAAANADDPWRVLGDIHILINELKDNFENQRTAEALKSVTKRINKSSKILGATKHFIREGDLAKKCRSRNRTYRFFLFNDQLVYADRGLSGKWNAHNCLSLRITRLIDHEDGTNSKHSFQILNPVKNLIVFADTRAAKTSWLRDLQTAITEANKVITKTRRFSKCPQFNLAGVPNDKDLPLTQISEGTETEINGGQQEQIAVCENS